MNVRFSEEEEKVTSLFQPDTLLADKYLGTLPRKSQLEPEKDLMLAVLEDAVACFQKYVIAQKGKEKALFRAAEDWITEENKDWLFSFETICDTLGLNPKYLREGLLRWKQMKLERHPEAKIYRLNPGTNRKKTCVMGCKPTEDEDPESKLGPVPTLPSLVNW